MVAKPCRISGVEKKICPHLSSTAGGVAALHAICSKFLFLETICFPAALEDYRLQEVLELKDLPYFFGNKSFGVTGHKLESGY
jgi:hypothetical protein